MQQGLRHILQFCCKVLACVQAFFAVQLRTLEASELAASEFARFLL